MTAEKALLFEPSSATTRKFLEVIMPRLQVGVGAGGATGGAGGDWARCKQSARGTEQRPDDERGIHLFNLVHRA